MNIFVQIVNLFYAPAKLFNYIKIKKSWASFLVPLLIVIAVKTLFTYYIVYHPSYNELIKEKTMQVLEKQQVEEKNVQEILDNVTSDKIKIFSIVSAFFGKFVNIILLALIVLGLVKGISGMVIDFLTSCIIIALSSLIGTLEIIIRWIIIFFTDNININLSLLAFLPEGSETQLSGILASIVNPFDIWFIGICASGVSIITDANYKKTAIMFYVLWFVFYALVGVISFYTGGLNR